MALIIVWGIKGLLLVFLDYCRGGLTATLSRRVACAARRDCFWGCGGLGKWVRLMAVDPSDFWKCTKPMMIVPVGVAGG